MSFYSKPRFWVFTGVAVVAYLILYQIWLWEVERVEVPPGKFLVRIHKWGKDLPEGALIAPDVSYKGVMLDVLPEGRWFLNPIFWSYEMHDMAYVPAGECLVRTRKFGDRLEPGQIIATEDPQAPHKGQQGILRDVLQPGSYRINPYAYSVEKVKAVTIRLDQVGVKTLKVGDDPPPRQPADKDAIRYVVDDNYRGVQKSYVPPGSYYINPYVETITPVGVLEHQVDLADIEFPSRDGFILKPHVQVVYAVVPAKAPELLVRLADEGKLNQEDVTREQQDHNQILQKVILPHIRGYARIEGSKFDAKDFIVTSGVEEQKKANPRERLQRAMLEQVRPKCQELGIVVHTVTLANMEAPEELTRQISERDQARVEQAKNKVRLGQYKTEQEYRAAEERKQQKPLLVQAGTRKIQATTWAEQLKEVEESRLKQDLFNAQLRLEAARKQAEAVLSRGKAEAAVIYLQNEAEVAGLKKAVQGFTSVNHFAQYHILARLAPSLSEIFASDDSEFAKLFATYMVPAKPLDKAAAPAVPASPVAKP